MSALRILLAASWKVMPFPITFTKRLGVRGEGYWVRGKE